MNRLKGMCCYLSGAIDCAEDMGKGWREDITPFLEDMNVRVLNPLEHVFYGAEVLEYEVRPKMDKMLKEGDYEGFRRSMKQVMRFDLHAVDISSFLIVNFDINTFMCGTIDETMISTRMHKPILLMVGEGNKSKLPKWILGTIPPEFIFETWLDLKNYLLSVNANADHEFTHHQNKRWIFFDGDHMQIEDREAMIDAQKCCNAFEKWYDEYEYMTNPTMKNYKWNIFRAGWEASNG